MSEPVKAMRVALDDTHSAVRGYGANIYVGVGSTRFAHIPQSTSRSREAAIEQAQRIASIPVLEVQNAALRAALIALLPLVDDEIEQRQTGGNDEDWAELAALSSTAHAALRVGRVA